MVDILHKRIMFSRFRSGNPYLIHRNGTLNPGEHIRVAAFDPGLRNTGLYMEVRSERGVKTEIMALLKTEGSSPLMCLKNQLDDFLPQLEKCNYILIESQLSVSRPAIEVGSFLVGYLMASTTGPTIIEVDSHLKGTVIEIPAKRKGMTAAERKKELKGGAVDAAEKLLKSRGDDEGLRLLGTKGKRDDMSDCVCYAEAWCRLLRTV